MWSYVVFLPCALPALSLPSCAYAWSTVVLAAGLRAALRADDGDVAHEESFLRARKGASAQTDEQGRERACERVKEIVPRRACRRTNHSDHARSHRRAGVPPMVLSAAAASASLRRRQRLRRGRAHGVALWRTAAPACAARAGWGSCGPVMCSSDVHGSSVRGSMQAEAVASRARALPAAGEQAARSKRDRGKRGDGRLRAQRSAQRSPTVGREGAWRARLLLRNSL